MPHAAMFTPLPSRDQKLRTVDCLLGFAFLHEEMVAARSNAAVPRKERLNFCHLAHSGRGGQKEQCVGA